MSKWKYKYMFTGTLQSCAVRSGQGPVDINSTLASTVYVTLYFGGGGTGVSDFVSSLA
jgi:hypothetical protein